MVGLGPIICLVHIGVCFILHFFLHQEDEPLIETQSKISKRIDKGRIGKLTFYPLYFLSPPTRSDEVKELIRTFSYLPEL
jgi:hypothetical protein